ncbi:MAG TPA: hypothetical protein VIK18_23880 [Pirellulales bacterium]
MFIFLLIAASLQLAAACRCFASNCVKSGTAIFCFCGFLSFITFSPLLLIQFLALMATGLASRLVCWALKAQPRYFWAAGAIVSVAIFVGLGGEGPRQWSALKQRYPMESLAGRLAYETKHASPTARTGFPDRSAPAAVAELEKLYDHSYGTFWEQRRAKALSLVHASYVTQFVNSPGFGIRRGIPNNPGMLERSGRLQEPVPMPDDEMPTPDGSAQDAGSRSGDGRPSQAASAVTSQLEAAHRIAQIDFANVAGFGYVQDRAHVAGFLSHRFTQMPGADDGSSASQTTEPCQQWDTRRVELVSLLKHDQAMVYLSKNLPRMDELRTAPVRRLDAFEEEGLAALGAGQEIHTRDYGERIRMLGAVRAVRQCIRCHEVEHGALLGAFSYEFQIRQPAAPQ